MRRFGEAYNYGKSYRDRPGAYAVIRVGKEVLLVRQDGFLLPGGGIDPGESPVQALHREIWEETGWRVAPRRRLGAFQRFVWLPDELYWARKVCHIYLCDGISPLGPPMEPDHTPVLMDPEEALARLTVSGERAFFAQAMGQLFSR